MGCEVLLFDAQCGAHGLWIDFGADAFLHTSSPERQGARSALFVDDSVHYAQARRRAVALTHSADAGVNEDGRGAFGATSRTTDHDEQQR